MQDDNEDLEYERIRRENRKLLKAFRQWLTEQKLATRTVQGHVDNVAFFLEEFLLYEAPESAAEGIHRIGTYLGYWFIRKAIWASPTSLKANAASLKKFYAFMREQGKVTPIEVREMNAQIKEELPEWVATLARYDDLDVDPEDVWRF